MAEVEAEAQVGHRVGGRNIDRALELLARVEFTPVALRADLAASRVAPRYLFAASELIDHAADLLASGSVITRDNDRRWRVLHERIREIVASAPGRAGTAPLDALRTTATEAGPASLDATVVL